VFEIVDKYPEMASLLVEWDYDGLSVAGIAEAE